MLLIGESLIYNPGDIPDFNRCFQVETISLDSYSDKVVCLSFIDYDTGWDWLRNLISLRNRLNDPTHYQFISVVFGLSESLITTNKVGYKITDPTMIGLPADVAIPEIDAAVQTADDFVICIDDDDGGASNPYKKYAELYGDGISGVGDSDFTTAYTGSAVRVFLASPGDDPDNPGTDISLVSDKWHSGTTAVSPDPLFFRRIRIARLTFANAGGNDLTTGETVTIPLETLDGIGTGNSVTLTNNAGTYEYTSSITSDRILAVYPHNGATSDSQLPVEVEFAGTPPTGFNIPASYVPSAASTAGVTISLAAEDFSGGDYNIAERYLLPRMTHLVTNPVLLYADPWDGKTVASLGTIILQFSKPLDEGNTTDPVLLQISGGGNSGLVYDPGFADNPDKYRNTLTLTLSAGSLNNANASNEVTLTLGNTDSSHHLTDKAGNFLTGDRIIEYDADVTAPAIATITSDTANGPYTTGAVIDIDVTFSEDVILTGGTLVTVVDADGGAGSITLTQSPSNPAFFTGPYTVSDGDTSDDLTVTGIALNPVTATLEDAVGHSADLTLPVSDNLADNKAIVIDTSTPVVDKQHISFVLDYSGSMDDIVIFDGNSNSKKEWVKTAVRDFVIHLLDSVASDDYSVGIVLYSTGVLTPLVLTDKSALSIGAVNTALAQTPAQDMTAMGKGLAHGLNMLSVDVSDADFNGRRAVVLLADGQQNIPPHVITSETDATHAGMDFLSLNTLIPALGTVTLDYQQDLKVHTIGIGESEGWLLNMGNVASATGGEYCANEDAWPLIMEQCTNLLPELFPFNSPQIVRNSQILVSPRLENRFPFPLNGSVRKLVVALHWTGQKEYEGLLKNGNIAVPFTKVKRGENFFIGEVNLPTWGIPSGIVGLIQYGFKTDPTTNSVKAVSYSKPFIREGYKSLPIIKYPGNRVIQAKGTWSVTIVEAENHKPVESQSRVLFSVIADEKSIHYDLGTSPVNIATGDIFQYRFDLKKKNGTIPGKAIIKAIFKLPGKTGTAPGPAVFLRPQIVKTPLVMGLFRKKLSRITLGNQIRKIRIPGQYKTAYTIRCDLGKEGIYERVVTRYFNVVALPDQKMSQIKILTRDDTYLIEVEPKDKFGNLLGPGYGSMIQIDLPESSEFKISDKGNGSYEIVIPKGIIKNEDRIPDLIFKAFRKLLS